MAISEVLLGDLDGRNGFLLTGVAGDDAAGGALSFLGDINGDGVSDLAVAAYRADVGMDVEAGEVYVLFGDPEGFGATVSLGDLDGTDGFAMQGEGTYSRTGYAISRAGDFNGDGFDDLIIGSQDQDEVYIVFGSDQPFGAGLELTALDGSDGVALAGPAGFGNSDTTVSRIGDFNDDGIDDVIVGAQSTFGPNGLLSGEAYVVFGSDQPFGASIDLDALDGTDGFAIPGIGSTDFNGTAVAGGGDLNADGVADLVTSAIFADPDGRNSAGEIYVLFGTDAAFGASVDLTALDGTNGFTVIGEQADDRAGLSLAIDGDINGDGIDDLIIGAPLLERGGNDAIGATYVVFGSSTGFDAVVDLGDLDGTNGFRLDGVAAGDQTGRAIDIAGDVNGDGIDDLIIGAEEATPNGVGSGRAYLVFGTDQGFQASVDLGALDGSDGFTIDGLAAGDYAGVAVGGAGDLNGDGLDDLAVGAKGESTAGADAGGTYIIYGFRQQTGTGQGETLTGEAAIDVLEGLSGNDVLIGLGGDDTLLGGGGDDTLIGGAGRDHFDGSAGSDTVSYEGSAIRNQADIQGLNAGIGDAEGDTFDRVENLAGGTFIDVLFGDQRDNIVSGNQGSDRVQGRAGDDTLDGGVGFDKLYGNAGADVMTGGGGNDRFIYFQFSDSRVGVGNRDVITDFNAGDRIELSRLDADETQNFNQAFDFIGTAQFTAAGQLRFFQSVGQDRTILLADSDGDGAADFQIELSGLVDLEAGDFVL
ncbi:MAG: hypothetical protein AAF415_06905 [Pseudomonadota bacterium]